MSTGTSELLHPEGAGVATEEVLSGEERAITARSPLQLFWRRFRRDKVAMAALAFIVLLILIAIFAPLIVKAVGARIRTSRTRTRSTTSACRPARAPITSSASTRSAATSSRAPSTAPASR